MSNSKRYARKIAKRLLQENEKGRPWRAIAREFPEVVKPGTLCRIAKSQGEWLPKDKEILAALGLYKPRDPYPRPSWLYSWYHRPITERYAVMKSHVENPRRTDDEEQRRQKKETRKILEWIPE